MDNLMLEVKLPKNKPILISSIYRQWSLPKSLSVPNSNNIHHKTSRWQTVIDKWKKAHNENKEVIVMTDDNKDHNNTNFNNTYKISNIKGVTNTFLIIVITLHTMKITHIILIKLAYHASITFTQTVHT